MKLVGAGIVDNDAQNVLTPPLIPRPSHKKLVLLSARSENEPELQEFLALPQEPLTGKAGETELDETPAPGPDVTPPGLAPVPGVDGVTAPGPGVVPGVDGVVADLEGAAPGLGVDGVVGLAAGGGGGAAGLEGGGGGGGGAGLAGGGGGGAGLEGGGGGENLPAGLAGAAKAIPEPLLRTLKSRAGIS